MAPASIPASVMIALAACASPVFLPATAHADPEVPTGAICDAVAPIVAGTQQDQDGETDSAGKADPTQSLAKAQQIQDILARVQRGGGLTSGASGDDINTIVRAAQSGDIGGAAGAGIDLANTLRPKLTGEGPDSPTAEPDASQPPQPAQSNPLVDKGMLDTARNTMRQDCERIKADQEKANGPDHAASDDASPSAASSDDAN